MPYATAVVLLGFVLVVNTIAIVAARLAARAGRSGEAVSDGDRDDRGPRPARRLRRQGGPARHLARRPRATRSSPSSARPIRARRTLLKCLNRTIELIPGASVTRHDPHRRRGRAPGQGRLRAAAPQSAWSRRCRSGCRCRSTTTWPSPRAWPACSRQADLDEIVERCLRQAALWDEVKDRLDSLGTTLSGGQQQRLTIARALSHRARDPLPGRVLHRHRPGDHHAHRGRADGAAGRT